MEEFVKLFEPGRINKLEVKNRIIMSPTGSKYSTNDGFTTDHEIAMWEARAEGGVGLIHKTLWAFTSALGPAFFPGHLEINDEEHIESAKRFTKAIKKHGTKVSCFISHPGKSMALFRPGVPVVAPSAIKDPLTGVMPKELSINEIEVFIEEFAEGAKRGKLAGFDAVMFQGGHGYLIHQFLSPRTNKRKDDYGGNITNRARFACEIIRRARDKVGPDFPIMIRMNGDDHIEGGISLAEAVQQALMFVDAGVNALDVSSGPREAHHWQFITHIQPYGPLIYLAKAIKKAVKVPVTTVGKINFTLAEQIIQEGSADFVGFCRSLLADPGWPKKIKEGRFEDIRPCIYCNQCADSIARERPCGTKESNRFCCSVNPAMGWEKEYELEMRPSPSPKKVIVVGGGLAGMETARTLAERGHQVILYEKSHRLGGQWNVVSTYHPEYSELLLYLSTGLNRAGVKIFLNNEVNKKLVEEVNPDAVVLATGAEPCRLDVPGSEGENVVLAVDVLSNKVNTGNEVVIIGGRAVGLDTAIFLAKQDKKVSIIEMEKIAWGLSPTLKLAYREYMIEYGVYTYPGTVVESITANGVNALCDGELVFLKADTVIFATGSKSVSSLAEQLKGHFRIFLVGDCVEPSDALTAINEGSALGRSL